MKAEIIVRPGQLSAMLDLLGRRMVPIFEAKGGWRLCACFVQRTGRLNTIVDIWELEDYGHFERGYAVFRDDPEYPAVRADLDRFVESETIVFMDCQFGDIAGTRSGAPQA